MGTVPIFLYFNCCFALCSSLITDERITTLSQRNMTPKTQVSPVKKMEVASMTILDCILSCHKFKSCQSLSYGQSCGCSLWADQQAKTKLQEKAGCDYYFVNAKEIVEDEVSYDNDEETEQRFGRPGVVMTESETRTINDTGIVEDEPTDDKDKDEGKADPDATTSGSETKPDNKYFMLTENAVIWSDAKSLCENNNGRLATILNAQDQAAAKSVVRSTELSEDLWIGLKAINLNGDFRWSDDTMINIDKGDYYSNYGPTPNKDHAKKDIEKTCMKFGHGEKANWNLQSCKQLKYPLCEKI